MWMVALAQWWSENRISQVVAWEVKSRMWVACKDVVVVGLMLGMLLVMVMMVVRVKLVVMV